MPFVQWPIHRAIQPSLPTAARHPNSNPEEAFTQLAANGVGRLHQFPGSLRFKSVGGSTYTTALYGIYLIASFMQALYPQQRHRNMMQTRALLVKRASYSAPDQRAFGRPRPCYRFIDWEETHYFTSHQQRWLVGTVRRQRNRRIFSLRQRRQKKRRRNRCDHRMAQKLEVVAHSVFVAQPRLAVR